MATKSIAWQTGTGNILLTYTGQGNGTVQIESDANTLGTARSQVISVKTTQGGIVTKNITINQAACPFPVGDIRNYSYTGDVQSVFLPAGSYKLQCWGAQGGSNAADSTYGITEKAGGKGGYSEGVLTLSSPTTVYIFVGGQGSSSGNGGWNGGGGCAGSSYFNSGDTLGVSRYACGGGATDIALVTSTMSYTSYRTDRSSDSLLSRMIVAGGGSGGAMAYKKVTSTSTVTENRDGHNGWAGGGTSGDGYVDKYKGRQNAAGDGGANFGIGANDFATNYRYCAGAGGGGWYGGGSDINDNSLYMVKASGGGSGFVNTSANASYRPTGYTGLQLDSGETMDGNTSFPAPGGGTETGHEGNGYARITRLA